MSDEEELDIVRSLELTAEGSYDDGYVAGLAAANEQIEQLRACLKKWYEAKQFQGKCACGFCMETRTILGEKS